MRECQHMNIRKHNASHGQNEGEHHMTNSVDAQKHVTKLNISSS
jgi:hypothetical protein